METIKSSRVTMDDLEELISAGGFVEKFTKEETEKSGRDYLIACSKNDENERTHRAEVMKDASRIVIY